MMRKIILTTALLLTNISFSQMPAFAENIAVIVNKDSPLFTNKPAVEISDIKDVYLGKLRFAGGSLIKAVNQNNKDIAVKFIKKVCSMDFEEYLYHWVKLDFETGVNAPRALERGLEVIGHVQEEKTGIGYVWEEQAKGIEGLKIILVISE